jgi:diguanylate cyclase (GGDEF)-like protein
VGPTAPERITDPLSAVQPDAGERARARLRQAGALLFGAGAVTLGAVLGAPDPDVSDHAALGACAVVYGLAALVLLLWRPPTPVLHAICPVGTVAATAAVALSEPVGLTPVFYLWPMLVAAYFLGRREVAANFAFVALTCGVALALWVDPVLRLAMFLAVLAIVGVVTAVIVVLREQVLELVHRLRTLASRDSLTGALNRGAFEQRLDAELARAGRAAAPLALVGFDVDHFKSINDSFGHAAGDQVLRGISDAVSGSLRRSDVFGRLGGEEFGLLLPETEAQGAATVADKLRRMLSAPTVGGRTLTVSFGVAQAPRNGEWGARKLLAEADRALYAAKRAGRDRVVRADQILFAGNAGPEGRVPLRVFAQRAKPAG